MYTKTRLVCPRQTSRQDHQHRKKARVKPTDSSATIQAQTRQSLGLTLQGSHKTVAALLQPFLDSARSPDLSQMEHI
ncbi:hypothetical protein TNCV_946631 [Trichonephila clavipes]|nr:hypothetical protein TNCV_946631 [Trichonephila clavipes]